MKKYFKGLVFYAVAGPLAKLFETLFELIIPIITSNLIDNIGKVDIIQNVLQILLFVFLGLIFAVICQYFSARCAFGFSENLRKELFSRITEFKAKTLDRYGSSTLITRVITDTDDLQIGLNYLLRLAPRTPFLVIGAIIAALLINIKLSFIFIIMAVLVSALTLFILPHAVKRHKSLQEKLDNLTTITRENITGSRVIRAFSRENYENKKFSDNADKYAQNSISAIKIDNIINPITFLILNAGIVLIIHFGSVDVKNSQLSQGDLAALINYLTMILLAIMQVVAVMPLFIRSIAARKRINDLLKEDLEYDDEDSEETIGSIECKNITMFYENSEEPVIENCSFSVKRGDCLGIIGGTGSGKSTLIQILLGFYPIQSGEILINGTYFTDFSLGNLRRRIGVVTQKAVIFKGTVRNNLEVGLNSCYLSVDTEDSLYNKALKTSKSYDFVNKLEKGIDTEISQMSLSGGQRQRIHIARVLMRGPDVLVLDDSTSALDYETEKELITAIRRDYKDKILLIITQRTNLLEYCNKTLQL